MPLKSHSNLPKLLASLYDKSLSRKTFLLDEKKITYGDLQALVTKTRNFLRNHKLNLNDRIAIASRNKLYVSALYLTCIMEGVTAVILDPDASAAEITILFTKATPKIAFFDEPIIKRAEILQQKASSCVIIPIGSNEQKRTSFSLIIRKKQSNGDDFYYPEIVNIEPSEIENINFPESTAALILFTSGTTSKPKGVVLTHLNIESQLQVFIKQFKLDKQSRLVNHLPLHHTDGINQGPLLAIAAGASWISSSAITINNLGHLLDTIYKERATHFITVPTVLAMISRLPQEYNDTFSSREFCFIESTAGKLEEELWRSIENRFSTQVVNCYGLTETVSEAIYSGPDKESRRIGSIGKPQGCEVRIIDSEGKDVEKGIAGELILRGNIVMSSYYNDDEATEKAFIDGWFKTGDLATCDTDGFYYIVGRIKNVIIRGGLNVYPEDITTVLLAYNNISSAITIGLDDELLGERVISCVSVPDPKNPPLLENIFTHCREHLAKEKIPNEILFFDKLPYGPSGKVSLKIVKEKVRQITSKNQSISSEQSTNDAVINLAAAVFHVNANELNPNSDQTNTHGWDSLAFLDFIMSIEKSFGIKLPPRDIMNMQTLGDAIKTVETLTTNNT